MTATSVRATWFDLPAQEPTDAMAFYEGLFAWKFVLMKEPAIENYWLIQSGNELIGGLRGTDGKVVDTSPGNSPIIYFTVENLAAKAARAKELGAKLVGERVELGDKRGAYQWFRDRQNNLVALFSME